MKYKTPQEFVAAALAAKFRPDVEQDFCNRERLAVEGAYVVAATYATVESWGAGTHDGIRDSAGSRITAPAGTRKWLIERCQERGFMLE